MPLTQDGRPIKVTTPLGDGKLFATGISGQEYVSQLFHFRLELVAPNDEAIDFGQLLGAPITVEIVSPSLDGTGPSRFFNGYCSRLGQGERGAQFTSYWMDLVPKTWFSSKKARSKVYTQKTVPQIIESLNTFTGIWDDAGGLTSGWKSRDYCVQYRETDLNFACRLMEEEGIFFFYKHMDGDHLMYVGDTPGAFPAVDGDTTVMFSQAVGAAPAPGVVTYWQKTQELRSARYNLSDYHFEKPDDTFQAMKDVTPDVQVGTVKHKLKFNGPGYVSALELIDYPGEYAQRFDGIDPGGAEQAVEIANIATDKDRVVAIRMQEEVSASVEIRGSSTAQAFQAGRKFTLEGHHDADGDYVITSVTHNARLLGGFDPATPGGFTYSNSFTCIPAALPFRPKRVTPKPVVYGTQSAVVVGASDNEIFTDKYGRVKVQFHWDGYGIKDANSSCWIRVATLWAGNKWGMIHIPRVGQEVIVAFEEGDPDQPIIVGSVFNAANMPPYQLPENKTQSGIKSRSTLQGTDEMFNELRFEDKKDSEDIYFHAQKDFHRVVENDDDLKVGHDQTIDIKNARTEVVQDGDETITIKKGKRTVTVETGDDIHLIKTGNRELTVETGNDTHMVKTGNREVTVKTGNDTHMVETGNRETTVKTGNDALTVSTGNQTTAIKMGNMSIKCDMGKITLEALSAIELIVGSSKVSLTQTGVTISGMTCGIDATTQSEVKGLQVSISASAMLQAKGAITMIG